MIDVKIKRMSDTAILPTYGSEFAACVDLYADIPVGNCYHNEDDVNRIAIEPHTTIYLSTGFSMKPPTGYCGLIYARSGLSSKEGLRPANCVGVVDEDYRGTVIVALHNDSEMPRLIKHGQRIAQMMFAPYLQASFTEVASLDATSRGEGGFGSTGI